MVVVRPREIEAFIAAKCAKGIIIKNRRHTFTRTHLSKHESHQSIQVSQSTAVSREHFYFIQDWMAEADWLPQQSIMQAAKFRWFQIRFQFDQNFLPF